MAQSAPLQRFNLRSLVNIGIVAGLLAVVAHFGGHWMTAGSTSSPTETASALGAAPELAGVPALAGTVEVGQVFNFATEVGNIRLVVVNVAGDQVTLTDSEGDSNTVSLAQITGGTLPAEDVEAAIQRMMQVVEQRRASGYYERNKPAGWHWASEQPASVTQTAMIMNDGGLLGSLPRGGNYVPEHWPTELRALLQYPSGLRSQQWAQENLP